MGLFGNNQSTNTEVTQTNSSSAQQSASPVSSVANSILTQTGASASSQNQSTNTLNAQNLSQYNGLNGQKCYVAVNTNVYDLTESPDWKNGSHTPSGGRAKCGQDGTELIKRSPHGESVLSGWPVVAQYTK